MTPPGRWLLVLALTLPACRGDAPAPPPPSPPEATAPTEATAAEAAPVQAPALPPPAQAPALTELLDAALSGPVPLPEAARERLRALQAAAGDALVLATPDGLAARAEALLAAAAELPAHGLDPSVVPQVHRDELAGLVEEALATDWTGEPTADRARARTLVHAEHALAHLLLALAQAHGATRVHPPEEPARQQARLVEALATWDDPTALLATLPPTRQPYERLRAALPRYEALAAAGGFVEVPREALKATPGKAHPAVAALRARLAQEDQALDPAAGGETWDEALTEALRRAREAYQLEPPRRGDKGLVDKALLEALAVPVTERIATLRLNLDRWRASALNDFPYAVFVNVPDYHGEVWDGPERVHRFRVVVGGTQRERGRMVNATPTLVSYIHQVIYNPYWNVPRRILERELKPDAEKYAAEAEADAPDYWARHRFEVMGGDDPARQWVRREPGPGNALGKVKIIFENRDFVFLHDTPAKTKFKATRRAFSHGCMRVDQPLDLARLLLERDGSWQAAEDARVMKHYKETPIPLDRRVPIVVDYVTARVDDAGRVHFLHDVYRRDRVAAVAR